MSFDILHGDCLDVLSQMQSGSFDACITDPPYELGFMGKSWDRSGVATRVETWSAVFGALKPGAHLLAFGGTRTYHRMACAIEDAGFEIRDTAMWLYGTGFPKSHDVSKGIDKALGAERQVVGINPNHRPESGVEYEGVYAGGNTGSAVLTAPATPEAAAWQGWGTALKPAWEPIIIARRPLDGTVAANVLAHGTGALNIDASRVPLDGGYKCKANGRPSQTGLGDKYIPSQANTPDTIGRWPANVIHDGSAEVEEAFAAFGERKTGNFCQTGKSANTEQPGGWTTGNRKPKKFTGDSGTASRFFYSAKAGKADRAGSKHPTVKPLALMRYLCKLVTPPGGRILDPFAGSGTTIQAATECGFNVVGIEMQAEYVADIQRRMAA